MSCSPRLQSASFDHYFLRLYFQRLNVIKNAVVSQLVSHCFSTRVLTYHSVMFEDSKNFLVFFLSKIKVSILFPKNSAVIWVCRMNSGQTVYSLNECKFIKIERILSRKLVESYWIERSTYSQCIHAQIAITCSIGQIRTHIAQMEQMLTLYKQAVIYSKRVRETRSPSNCLPTNIKRFHLVRGNICAHFMCSTPYYVWSNFYFVVVVVHHSMFGHVFHNRTAMQLLFDSVLSRWITFYCCAQPLCVCAVRWFTISMK